jgi:hypothetical protein
MTRVRLLRDGLTLVVLLVLLRLLDPSVTPRTLALAAAVWTAGWGFWAWRDYRAWRRGGGRANGDGADGGADDGGGGGGGDRHG